MGVIVDRRLPCGARLRIHDDRLTGVSEKEMEARRARFHALAGQMLRSAADRQAERDRRGAPQEGDEKIHP